MSKIFTVLLFCAVAQAHIALWHPSAWDPEPLNKQSNNNSNPIQDLPFSQWWFHNNLNFPPAAGNFFDLPANGNADIECSSNRAFTSYGFGLPANPRDAPDPWSSQASWISDNNLHAPGRTNVSGCALAITYNSNEFTVQPSDFVIFTVVHDCPARPLQSVSIPNLPACPAGGCICSWFWIHKSIGGSDQNYMTPFRCQVSNVSSNTSPIDVANARAPRKCHNPADCVRGPRNPMYWKNLERNNMPEPGHYAPNYGILYGFPEGAQHDIFVNTNTVNHKVIPLPPPQTCQNTTLNPNGFASRLVSTQSNTLSTLNGGGLVSPGGIFKLNVQGDGNVFIQSIATDEVPWGCACNGAANGNYFNITLGTDGLISIYNDTGYITWSSVMTQGYGQAPYVLQLHDEGYLALYDGTGADIWESWYFDQRESFYTPFDADPAIWSSSTPILQAGDKGASWALAPVFALVGMVALLL